MDFVEALVIVAFHEAGAAAAAASGRGGGLPRG